MPVVLLSAAISAWPGAIMIVMEVMIVSSDQGVTGERQTSFRRYLSRTPRKPCAKQ